MIYIGIDTGTHTGVAIWDSPKKEFVTIETLPIHKAMRLVERFYEQNKGLFDIQIIFEDARLRRWIPDSGDIRREMGRRQGAGSVKRDCTIWEEFLKDLKIPYEAVKPARGATKMNADYFKRLTGWTGRTSEHSRDAGMLVFGR